MRKHYLDNLRWITICLVVIFHVFFYYNNIGTAAMFEGAAEYTGQISFAGLFQYFVYPWFMLVLFVVSGVCARISLQTKTAREFLKSRIHKLLVPSTLGVLAFGWIGGYVIYLHMARANIPAEAPKVVGAFISVFSGIGALWFCHVLFIAVLALLLFRWIARKCSLDDDRICKWFGNIAEKRIGFPLLCLAMYLILWGGSHILNVPVITSYRNGIYIPAFFMGFYIFSCDAFMEKLKRYFYITGLCALAFFMLFIVRNYGKDYSDVKVLSQWDTNFYAVMQTLFVMGFMFRFEDATNSFMTYMAKNSFGLYVLHIPVMLVTNYLLKDMNMPIALKYCIEGASAFAISFVLQEIIVRIPLLRYFILGFIRKDTK